ncbi:MAG: sulfatase [Planctomycetota bacterium]
MPLCLRVGSLLLMAAMCAGCSAEPPPRARGIVLITLDTTRADHLGVYGHAGGVSPSTDALAAESEVFEHAISPSSWTLPAHASLFTGKLPTAHGAEYAKNGPLLLAAALPDEDLGEYRARGLDRGEVTLAERLRQAGYATHAVVAGPWLKRVFGLDAGFATYDDQGINHVNGRPANEVTDAAIAWLRQQASQPFFLFLNYYDAHAPYLPPPAAKERFFDPLPAAAKQDSMQAANALYDAEIWFADQHVGRLFAFLKETGRWDDTLIVVTADHGDLLGEHGRFGHGRSVTQAEIHVPLIIKQPRSRAASAACQRRCSSPMCSPPCSTAPA